MAESRDTAVLLVNLGSPESCTAPAIRRFLAEFLSDPRIVDLPRWLWLPILWCFILPFRPRRLVAKYRSIWRDGDAPIRLYTRRQAEALQQELATRLADRAPRVSYAMTYGEPSVRAVLGQLLAEGVRRLVVLPLYPQYSATTTGAAFDVVAAALKTRRDLPELRMVRDYHDHPAYIAALCASLRPWHENPDRDLLLFSFHGIPQSQAADGDPYPGECQATARLVAERLGLADGEWRVTFQSRFGPAPWLQPYTDATLEALATGGTTSVTVICPGFSADCLETLEEIDEENRALFLTNGGQAYAYVPALNDQPGHIQLLADLAERQLAGWRG